MIRVLPPLVVNQIAAGEVIERPFSVVRELVENSLDAGAHRIQVELVEGGLGSIRVVDDGRGFAADDLPLAFASHATSKLAQVGDLDHIASLGFRGEALASVGSVSRAVISSRAPGAEAGSEVRCTGGQISQVQPCGCPVGTVVEVRDLFYNTPARRKFLRSGPAERARIQDLLVRLALARLDVDFTLVVDGKRTLRMPKGESLQGRLQRAFGTDVTGGLLEKWEGTVRVWDSPNSAIEGAVVLDKITEPTQVEVFEEQMDMYGSIPQRAHIRYGDKEGWVIYDMIQKPKSAKK